MTTIAPEKVIIGGVAGLVGLLFVANIAHQPFAPDPLASAPVTAATPESVAKENELKVRWACEDSIKAKLNDPNSYEARNVETLAATDATKPTWVQVRVDFGARNGFGGMVPGKAVCNFDRNAQLIVSAIA